MLSVSLVSAGTAGGAGTPPDGVAGVSSRAIGSSADGRFVLFTSNAANLVANDGNGVADVFVRDVVTGSTTLISAATGGGTGNGASGLASGSDTRGAAISDDGRFVVFVSSASNLIAGDTNDAADLFLYDRESSQLTLISQGGTAGDGGSSFIGQPALSSDGRFVAFVSTAEGLVEGQESDGGAADVFFRDIQLGLTSQLSIPQSGSDGSGSASGVSMSSDGRYVAFAAAGRITAQTPDESTWQIYVHDRVGSVVTLVSASPDGVTAGNANSLSPSLSDDGRKVAFLTAADNLVPGMVRSPEAAVDAMDVIHRNLDTGESQLGSRATGTATSGGNGGAVGVNLSGDGRFATFYSAATNLTSVTDDNNSPDAYIFDAGSGVLSLLSGNASGTGVAANGSGNTQGSGSAPAISSDGRFVVFGSFSTDIAPGDSPSNLVPGLFLKDMQTAAVRRLLLDRTTSSGAPVFSNAADPVVTDDAAVYFAADGLGLPGHETTSYGFQVYGDGAPADGGGGNNGGDGTIDLSATVSASIPASVVTGTRTKASANVRVTNNGTATAGSPITITLYASADGLRDSSDVPLAVITKNLKLKAAKSKSVKLKFDTIPSVAEGVYQLLAEVTGISENNLANNVAAAASAVTFATPYVDLFGSALTAPKPVRAGKRASTSLVLSNGGNTEIPTTPTIVRVTATPVAGGSPVVVDVPVKVRLGAGSSKRIKLKFALPADAALGDYTLAVELDAVAVVAERDEANNVLSGVSLSVVG